MRVATQIDLFAPPPPPLRSDSRAAGTSYKTRRDAGIARARDHAEADLPGWTETAAAFLAAYADDCGGTFLVEQARAASVGRLPQAANDKAWGAAAVFAIRRGWIAKAGYGPASSSNGSPKTLYSRKAFR
jgi:hypothetical protein